jgi:hypothetical protein
MLLVVIEAKAPGKAALPQLLIYLASVQDARLKAKKYIKLINKPVFGLATYFRHASTFKKIRKHLSQNNWIGLQLMIKS